MIVLSNKKAVLAIGLLLLPLSLLARGLGELATVPDSTTITMTYPATVIAQAWRGYVYVVDGTGYGVIYFGTDANVPKYDYGDVIPAGFHAIKTTYNDEPMLVSPTGLKDVVERDRDVPITPITCAQLNHSHWAHLCVIRNARIYKFYGMGTASDATGKTCILNNEFNITFPEDEELHDIYGVVASVPHLPLTNWYEFWPISIDVEPRHPNHDQSAVEGIEDLMDRPQGTAMTFKTPLIAVWQHDQYLLVKDIYGAFGMVKGPVAGHFENGDSIINAQACWEQADDDYDYDIYLIPVDSTFMPSGHGNPVEPKAFTAKAYNRHHYLTYCVIKDAKIIEQSDMIIIGPRTYYLDDGTDHIGFFNKYDIPFDVVTEVDLDDYIGFFNEYSISDFERFMYMLAHGQCERVGQLYDIEGYSGINGPFSPIKVTPTRTYKYHIGDLDKDGETTISDIELLGKFIRNWWGGDW